MDYSVGLSEREAKIAKAKFGSNVITRKPPVGIWSILLGQLKSPLVYVLLLAAGINLFLGEFIDTLVVMVTVILNTVLGFVQEYKAERSLESLSDMLVPTAKARRDREWKIINASDLVPGDVIRLEVGQRIPADGVLTRADGLFINEAVLTGESMPIEKHQYDFKKEFTIYNFQLSNAVADKRCYMGTVVERGIGEMLVVKSGMETNLGQIAKDLSRQTIGRTPPMKKLDRLSHLLALMVLLIVPVIAITGIASGKGVYEIFLLSLALAVSAIPEGLAVGLTVILTVGMRRILARKALVRKLAAAETLGSVDIICLDKTGTLTVGKMKVVGAETDKEEEMVLAAYLCNDERDPLEVAMMEWAKTKISTLKKKVDGWKRLATMPFDYRFKYIVTRHGNTSGKMIEYISGAPEVVLSKCVFKREEEHQLWKKKFSELGERGYRIVGFGVRDLAAKEGESINRETIGGYEWLGVVVFEDPAREGAAESLKRVLAANIGVKVITGDYKETAWAVLHSVGLVGDKLDPEMVITGEELATASVEKIERAVLFARVNPEQKLNIVSALQNKKHVVAMMGDGVNDAPALKQADIGVVVAGASDVARETAELVLLDNNFGTILSAVEEGRGMLVNLRKVVLYLLADAFAGVFLVIAAILLNLPLPILATQILWINLISDGFPYVALAIDPIEQGLLKDKPVVRDEPIISRKMFWLMLLISIVAGAITLTVFILYNVILQLPLVLSRTMALSTLGTITLTYVFSVKTLFEPFAFRKILANKWLIRGVGLGYLMLFLVVYWPPLQFVFGTTAIQLLDWVVVAVSGLVMLVVAEVIKRSLSLLLSD